MYWHGSMGKAPLKEKEFLIVNWLSYQTHENLNLARVYILIAAAVCVTCPTTHGTSTKAHGLDNAASRPELDSWR